jgi:hypothetical protein
VYLGFVDKFNLLQSSGFHAASSTSFNNMKNLNSSVHPTSNSMKENHKSVAILAPTLSSSNISINETNVNVFPVPGNGNCFFHSLSLILNGDFSMSNNYTQLICSFISQNWASWEDRILISHDKIFVYKCNVKR